MSYKFDQQAKKTARVRSLFVAALVFACAFGTVTLAAAQVTPPPVPDKIAVPAGNSAYLVGHAFGSQGYTCLPTSTGVAAWNPTARPEATLFTDLFGAQFQIITHFQSINENPKAGVTVPLSGNVTWQGSLDSSRVWAVKVNGIDPDPNVASCPNTGSIQCVLLQSVGNKKGANRRQPPGQNHLHPTSEHQRRSCSYHRLHCGSDSARTLHGRLLLLPQGPVSTSLPVRKVRAVHAKSARVAELRVRVRWLRLSDVWESQSGVERHCVQDRWNGRSPVVFCLPFPICSSRGHNR